MQSKFRGSLGVEGVVNYRAALFPLVPHYRRVYGFVRCLSVRDGIELGRLART